MTRLVPNYLEKTIAHAKMDGYASHKEIGQKILNHMRDEYTNKKML